jgi:hypothetical protein
MLEQGLGVYRNPAETYMQAGVGPPKLSEQMLPMVSKAVEYRSAYGAPKPNPGSLALSHKCRETADLHLARPLHIIPAFGPRWYRLQDREESEHPAYIGKAGWGCRRDPDEKSSHGAHVVPFDYFPNTRLVRTQ